MTARCPDCGSGMLNNETVCPNCGSRNRELNGGVEFVSFTETAHVEALIPHGPRPWQEMWSVVKHKLEGVERWYADEHRFNVTEIATDIYLFFVVCWTFKDHLKSDGAVPRGVRGAVEGYAHEMNSAINLTGDVANTFKHRNRSEHDRSVYITEVSGPPAKALLSWVETSGARKQKDCLKAASDAFSDWQHFLADHRLA